MLTPIQNHHEPFEKEMNSDLKALEQKVMAAARADGILCLPRLTGDSIVTYFGEYHHTIQQWIHRRAEYYRPETVKLSVITNNKEAELQLHEQLNKRSEAELRRNNATINLAHADVPLKWKHSKWAVPAILIVCMFDGIYATGLFTAWGHTQIESYLLAPLFTVLIAFISHMVPQAIELGTKRWHKWLIAAGLGLLLASFFTYLGIERARFLSDVSGIYHDSWPFILLTTISVCVSICISQFYLPHTRSEWQEIRGYKKLVKEHKIAEKEFTAINAQVTATKSGKRDVEQAGATTFEIGKAGEQRLMAFALSLLSIYIKTNIQYRTDGVPDFFASPEYPFKFITHFDFKSDEQ